MKTICDLRTVQGKDCQVLFKLINNVFHQGSFLFYKQFILFENLFKPRQLPSATSKQCFEQSAASFLVCSLIFIEC
ncbi:hypothetical protein BH628_09005 [Streptococcus pneumoniae]|nr:hypothetical protein BH616_01305 [Streptococcus pneumoniae]OKQ37679.1 hypothetical protein BH623_06780 [Streptococcus pneumoniae]OKQ42844.1 hypothetical protein BH625_05430 [Streptococcus pneumoniae]OKQ48837.1 hypothetical protein BH628_09005 [Streptococcus pneumoniae]OKQ64082.1 hypothetical protein BH635_10380 [Streptococcus pneumoniae]